ncbi:hypothetical protein [Streptomyces sp. LN245]
MPLPRRLRPRPSLGVLLAAACLTGAVSGPADAKLRLRPRGP